MHTTSQCLQFRWISKNLFWDMVLLPELDARVKPQCLISYFQKCTGAKSALGLNCMIPYIKKGV